MQYLFIFHGLIMTS